jgi:hypothetical protein
LPITAAVYYYDRFHRGEKPVFQLPTTTRRKGEDWVLVLAIYHFEDGVERKGDMYMRRYDLNKGAEAYEQMLSKPAQD